MTPPSLAARHPALAGLDVLERGWLSSNQVLLPACGDPLGATVIDSAHSRHAAQTVELVRHGLDGQPLARVINTHLHSDHCGGNAALQRAFGGQIVVPPDLAAVVQGWDAGLSFEATGQWCDRFAADAELCPSVPLEAGGRRWQVIPADGHDPDAVMLFDPEARLLISGDALWGDGFGVLFPELEGQDGLGPQQAALDHIEALAPLAVIPGHGAPFVDVEEALGRARKRLGTWRADPQRHTDHALRVLLVFHVMERGPVAAEAVRAWAETCPLLVDATRLLGRAAHQPTRPWIEALLNRLIERGALTLHEGMLSAR